MNRQSPCKQQFISPTLTVNMKVIIIIAAALIFSVFGKTISNSSRSGRIVGGNVADAINFSFQAFLEVKTGTVVEFCGGSIISNQFILTSAHCVETALWVDVKLGVKRLSDVNEPARQIFHVLKSEIFIHYQFDRSQILNDLAIVQLPQLIQFNEHIQPIRLPSAADNINELMATLSGFGHVSDGNRLNSDVLKYVNVAIMTIETCQQRFYGNLVNENNICTSGDNRQGACHSDYGGPLVVRRNNEAVLIGVISFGWPVCEAGKPTVSAKVQNHLRWIEQITNIDL